METIDRLERLFRFAKDHAQKAHGLLAQAAREQDIVSGKAEKANTNYRKTLLKGVQYVPVEFMKADNSFEGAKLRFESTQQELIMNIAYSLSFCSEIISNIVATQDVNLLVYRKRVRMHVEELISITQSSVLQRASLVALVPFLAQMESEIVVKDPIRFGRLRHVLKNYRLTIS